MIVLYIDGYAKLF